MSLLTFKQKFNIKYKQPKNKANSIEEIARLSGIKKSALLEIKKKGIGAFYSNPSSVRPNVTSAERWGIARVYSAVMGGKASRVDYTELKRGRQK